ncbi:hypothetical protein ARMSODRAFT_980840 [Armillaria solidipes]|uniref:Uncharacterized protein n=1 Tax=Armillaria solidipes TaxID=1076256 RepID=A0A2H3B5B2_9AGAR|nr:hypothetical protein ARMSODRAFT_980840 [Armillaria solidipes]
MSCKESRFRRPPTLTQDLDWDGIQRGILEGSHRHRGTFKSAEHTRSAGNDGNRRRKTAERKGACHEGGHLAMQIPIRMLSTRAEGVEGSQYRCMRVMEAEAEDVGGEGYGRIGGWLLARGWILAIEDGLFQVKSSLTYLGAPALLRFLSSYRKALSSRMPRLNQRWLWMNGKWSHGSSRDRHVPENRPPRGLERRQIAWVVAQAESSITLIPGRMDTYGFPKPPYILQHPFDVFENAVLDGFGIDTSGVDDASSSSMAEGS